MSTTAQIIDQHRPAARWVGDGVTVHCACGAEHWALVGGDQPYTDEHNSHREADRKHAQHVADALSQHETADTSERVLTWALLQYPSDSPLDQERRMVAAETGAFLSGATSREMAEIVQTAKEARHG